MGLVRLPSIAELRTSVGVVAHVFSTPIGDVWDMELWELEEWVVEAGRVAKLYGSGSGR